MTAEVDEGFGRFNGCDAEGNTASANLASGFADDEAAPTDEDPASGGAQRDVVARSRKDIAGMMKRLVQAF